MSTCAFPPNFYGGSRVRGHCNTVSRQRMRSKSELGLQIIVTMTLQSEWLWDFNNSSLAPLFLDSGYLAMWMALRPCTAASATLLKMKMSLRLQELFRMKKTSVVLYRPIRNCWRGFDSEVWNITNIHLRLRPKRSLRSLDTSMWTGVSFH